MLSQTYCDALLKFTIRMYQLLQSKNTENENVVCSAFSVACSLAMLAGGAGGSTSKQIFALLCLKASKDRIREHFSNLLTMLSGCAPDATFLVANRLYSDKRFPVQSGYVVLLESSYGATLKSVDFSSGHEVVRREANAWIAEQTASKVQDMLRPGSVDSRTVLVHISAIAFKSFWQFPFRSINTMPQDFRLDYKTNVRVNMMFLDHSFKIGHSEELGARALEIPYRGQKASMVILLPDEVEGLFCLEESMTSARISTLLANMKLVQDVEVSLPKFKLDYTLPLKETLKDLGVKDLFTPGKADLSGIFESGRPAVSEVIHKAAVEVYEEGTEPAASTTVVIESSGTIAAQAVRFVVDHPFMFLIKSNEPEVILFMGSVRKL